MKKHEHTRLRILFPEGSSLSARQALNALGKKGYIIDICDPNPYCICRFSKYVNRFHKSPAIGNDPIKYYKFILELVQREHFDVLLPIHESAFLFSKQYQTLSQYVHLAINPFESFEIMQSKIHFMKLLDRLDIPHPECQYLSNRDELVSLSQYPYYVKIPYGTAGQGTWKVENSSQMEEVIQELEIGSFLTGESEILVQQSVVGILGVVQSLFDHGSLVGAHCYELRVEGVGGSASARISVHHSNVLQYLEVIGKSLNWHGCLMLDYIYDKATETPYFIEANPRTGETMNGTLCGFNQADLLIKLSLHEQPHTNSSQRYGVKTHSLMAILLGIAHNGGTRRQLLTEIAKALFQVHTYKNSREDLTNIKDDLYSSIPLAVVALSLLIQPKSSTRLSTQAIHHYSISEETVKTIMSMS